MTDKNIWGCKCNCGNEVFDYFDEHPWCNDRNIMKLVACSKCGVINKIDCLKAEKFYNEKVLNCFSDIYGNVLEIGCGGGFVSEYVINLKNVNYLATLDIDDESIINMLAQNLKDQKNEKLIGADDVKEKFKNAMDEYLERMQDVL